MDWAPVIAFLNGLAPWVQYIFIGLGAVTVIATAIDALIPDNIDKGFMSKILAVPILGDFLKFLTRFSPFNIKEKQ